MTDKTSFKDDVVRQLANILNDTHLTEIEYEVEGCRIRVARQTTVAQVSIPAPYPAPAPTAVPAGTTPDPAVASTPADPSQAAGAVKAPMVGTAYMAATPGSAPFITIGASVTKGQTLMIIEAMKVMNQIKAPQDGTVKQILVKDSDPVEYGQVLVVLE